MLMLLGFFLFCFSYEQMAVSLKRLFVYKEKIVVIAGRFVAYVHHVPVLFSTVHNVVVPML